MRHLWIRYANGVSDVVNQKLLDDLIEGNALKEFYRPSESRWVTLGVDQVRGAGGRYVGPDRRLLSDPAPQRWINTAV